MTKETKIGMTALLLFLAIGIAALLLHPMERLFPPPTPSMLSLPMHRASRRGLPCSTPVSRSGG